MLKLIGTVQVYLDEENHRLLFRTHGVPEDFFEIDLDNDANNTTQLNNLVKELKKILST